MNYLTVCSVCLREIQNDQKKVVKILERSGNIAIDCVCIEIGRDGLDYFSTSCPRCSRDAGCWYCDLNNIMVKDVPQKVKYNKPFTYKKHYKPKYKKPKKDEDEWTIVSHKH